MHLSFTPVPDGSVWGSPDRSGSLPSETVGAVRGVVPSIWGRVVSGMDPPPEGAPPRPGDFREVQ